MISIIVATAENNVIGHLNKIPWYMPRDLKHFADTTRKHTVVMGRNTYESILARLGKPLPERKNIVVTRQKNFQVPAGCEVVHSLEEALEITPENEEIFIIGGSQLYAESIPKADKIYRTLIHTKIDGDVFFPEINKEQWKLSESKFEAKNDNNPFDASYEIYERIAK